jgi:hypothetical protein
MRRAMWSLVPAAVSFCGLLLSGEVWAITVPDSGTCTSTGACLQITQSGSSGNPVGLQGSASANGAVAVAGSNTSTGSNAIGVYGYSAGGKGVYAITSSGIGAYGDSSSFVGVYGQSGSYNAIYGINSVTDQSAAAISAQSGDNQNALAYWGGGGIEITSTFAQKGSAGSWTGPSDIRLKKDVRNLPEGLDQLMRVRTVRYKFNGLGGTNDDGHDYAGVIAQELENVMPGMLSTKMVKLHKDDKADTAIKILDPSDFTYVLIRAVQQQQHIIEHDDARISALEQGAPLVSAVFPFGLRLSTSILALAPFGLFLALRKYRKSINRG